MSYRKFLFALIAGLGVLGAAGKAAAGEVLGPYVITNVNSCKVLDVLAAQAAISGDKSDTMRTA